MNEFSPSDFLRREVYPRLDAVAEHLLDSLEPKPRSTSGSYPLICPECKAKEAFYFPFHGYINCPRKNECGNSTSLWDAMLFCGYEHNVNRPGFPRHSPGSLRNAFQTLPVTADC